MLTNDKIFPLINEANGSGLIWAVHLDKNSTHLAMQQLLPQAQQFHRRLPRSSAAFMQMTIAISADSGVDAKFQAVCDSVDDANLLGAAMQAGVMYRRYQEAQSNPAFGRRARSGARDAYGRSREGRLAREPGPTYVPDQHQGVCHAQHSC